MNYQEALEHKNNLVREASEYTKSHFNFVIVPKNFNDRVKFLAYYEDNRHDIAEDACTPFTNEDDFVVYGLATDLHRDYMMNKL
ncbi:hypothetical protein [Chryseobacterium sp. EZn1]|uniref:hypothetical protein n=1 Tax=Chryseobacterium cupriresistens TaxID=3366770 RepID=UPI003984F539